VSDDVPEGVEAVVVSVIEESSELSLDSPLRL
jgi:hypothetical protein